MCGIFGLIYPSSDVKFDLASSSVIDGGLNNLRFRGPDGNGVSRNKFERFSVCLAHSRLSVLDVSESGSQPMSYDHLEITFNGEIYNFLELRQELKGLGHRFNGNSDTEVILRAWHTWGAECANRFNGMFAFALLDKKSQQLWLVRDRFGVKPLFYALSDGNKLIFSSSAAYIGEQLKSDVNLDYCARAIRYKVFETGGCESPFEGINAVGPGASVQIDLTRGALHLTHEAWYDLVTAVQLKRHELASMTATDVQDECLSLFQSSVNLRLRSDVPLAVSLSGGLDSSSIAAITASEVGGLEGFSFGDPCNFSSEGPTVDRFAKSKLIGVNYIWPDYDKSEMADVLEQVFKAQEAPFGGLSVIAQHQVFKTVSDRGFKVLLGGQGGDEVFAGYRKFFVVAVREALIERSINSSMNFFFSLIRVLLSEIQFMGTYATAVKRYISNDQRNSLLNFEAEGLNLWGASGGGLLGRQIDDIKKFSIPTLLRFEDRNSMGNGVESRLPFLDYRLVEFGLAVPANLKIRDGYGKWIVRQIMKGRVSDEIRLERKKRGFDVTKNWIAGGVGDYLREIILSKKEALERYLNPGVDLDRLLSSKAMEARRLLLDEALMLAWLANPYLRN